MSGRRGTPPPVRHRPIGLPLWAAAFALWVLPAHAVEFPLRDDGGELIGEVKRVRTRYEDTLIQLARQYSLGYEELLRVNKGVDPWLPGAGTEILIPGQRLLPPGERSGIVVNLPEHRMYYFPKAAKGETPRVFTFPVSVGKMDWLTPLGVTRIARKQKDPAWYPPESVRKEHADRGDPPLPKIVPPGPDNPLGTRAMRLDIPGGSYLIHGTNNPDAVGMAVTHGCLRMYPEDVERLFDLTPVGTRVALVNEPLKLARFGGEVWVEVHPPIDAQGQSGAVDLEAFEARLNELLGEAEVIIDWDVALKALREAKGMPVLIGLELVPEGGAPDASAVAPARGVAP
ncbi:MAG: L,D-transpeptidase [Gammaproteobacteria bacterium]|nr:L,D-transpeptidase [Gammaproteobacteria bacterium]